MSNNPTITCEVVDVNPKTVALTGNSEILIRHHSTAQVTMYPVAYGGAAINLDTCIIENGGKRLYGMVCTFENVPSNTFELFCEDSEYRYGRLSKSAPMVEYIKLTCHAADNKPDANGNVTVVCSGDYFNGSFGVASNYIQVSCRYKKTGGTWSGWYTMTVSKSGNAYTAYANLTGLDYRSSYDFECQSTDSLMSVTASSLNVVSKPVFHWGENDVAFEVPVSFNGGITNPYINGNIYFDDNCYLGASSSNFIMNVPSLLLYVGGSLVEFPKCGTWTPTLTWSGVYSSRSGWYVKSGNVVTLGFHIKMTCDSGGTNDHITIYGLPYDCYPTQAASGGGMCSGAYVGAGFNFQCFVAETDGSITTRVQACNNTSAGNLSTSASGCNYPSNGVLTLSGTITYMTN